MIKNIIFDFDGVILDSVPVKTEAYRLLFKDYHKDIVRKMVDYHELNGGISRYKKVKYFFNDLLNQTISENDIIKFANKYSELTKEELTKRKYIIQDSVDFIMQNYTKYHFHIASGADETDLKYICDKLNLSQYFLTINGSPEIKTSIVNNIMLSYKYSQKDTILIGDSINDFQAASDNSIKFFGFNNINLKSIPNTNYISSFKEYF